MAQIDYQELSILNCIYQYLCKLYSEQEYKQRHKYDNSADKRQDRKNSFAAIMRGEEPPQSYKPPFNWDFIFEKSQESIRHDFCEGTAWTTTKTMDDILNSAIRKIYKSDTNFLSVVVDLPDGEPLKYIVESLAYFARHERDLYSNFYQEDKTNGAIIRYADFVKYVVPMDDFAREVLRLAEADVKRQMDAQTANQKYIRGSHTIHSRYIHGVTIQYRKESARTELDQRNKDYINAELRKFGFPYGESEDEYNRYLNTFKKSISRDLMDTQTANKRNCKFPASKITKILWRAPIERADFINHTYVVARSGSGKTEFLRTLMKEISGSCVLIDPHGDFADSLDGCKGFVKVAPQSRRFVVNPFDIADKSRTNRELVAQEITNLIRELISDNGLSSLMDTVVKPVIQTLLNLEYSDFGMLTDCFNPVSGVDKLEAITPLVDDTIRNWDAICGEQYETTKKSIFNRLVSFLNNGTIRDMVCGRDDFETAMSDVLAGGNLIFSLPSPVLGDDVSAVLGRFVMCRMQIWAKRRQALPERERTPVFLFVDECQNFLSDVTAKTLDQFGRKFGLFMVLAHQHIKQIEDSALKDSILTNCKNKIVGQASKSTRQALANEMGLDQSDYEDLERGYYWGTFERKGTIKFYSKLVKFERLGYAPIYADSVNSSYVDGWEFMPTRSPKNSGNKSTQKTNKQEEKIKPKFDIE